MSFTVYELEDLPQVLERFKISLGGTSIKIRDRSRQTLQYRMPDSQTENFIRIVDEILHKIGYLSHHTQEFKEKIEKYIGEMEILLEKLLEEGEKLNEFI